jgi:hypothetical protein
MVAVNNTLAETECKLKHQAKMPGRAPCKVTQVGSPSEKWLFLQLFRPKQEDITTFGPGFEIADI